MGPAPAATGLVKGKKAGGAHPSHPALGRGGDPHPPSVSPSTRPSKGHLGHQRTTSSSGSSGLRLRAAAGAAHGRQRSAGGDAELLFDMEPEEGHEKPRSPAALGGGRRGAVVRHG